MTSSFLFSLAIFLIPTLLPLIVALAAFFYTSLLQRLPLQQRLIVSSMAHTVVTAVEQMFPSDAPGAQKKDQALHALVAILSGLRITVPEPMLEMAIEAAVFELHTLVPHTNQDDDPNALEGPFPFPYRPTLRSLPTIELPSPTAPTAHLPRDPAPSAPTAQLPRDPAPSAPTVALPIITTSSSKETQA